MILLLQYTLIFASVLILVALGGCFAEHSGVINLGLEGIMIMGALGGALTMRYVPNTVPAIVMILAVIVVSALVGMVYSCLLAVAIINFKADQTLVGHGAEPARHRRCDGHCQGHQHRCQPRRRFVHRAVRQRKECASGAHRLV